MAKKSQNLTPLTLTEIILRGDVATIRQALEARTQIDSLLQEREAAYQLIAELETQVCEIVGEGGTFPFPPPPIPVADYPTESKPVKKKTAVQDPQAVSLEHTDSQTAANKASPDTSVGTPEVKPPTAEVADTASTIEKQRDQDPDLS